MSKREIYACPKCGRKLHGKVITKGSRVPMFYKSWRCCNVPMNPTGTIVTIETEAELERRLEREMDQAERAEAERETAKDITALANFELEEYGRLMSQAL